MRGLSYLTRGDAEWVAKRRTPNRDIDQSDHGAISYSQRRILSSRYLEARLPHWCYSMIWTQRRYSFETIWDVNQVDRFESVFFWFWKCNISDRSLQIIPSGGGGEGLSRRHKFWEIRESTTFIAVAAGKSNDSTERLEKRRVREASHLCYSSKTSNNLFVPLGWSHPTVDEPSKTNFRREPETLHLMFIGVFKCWHETLFYVWTSKNDGGNVQVDGIPGEEFRLAGLPKITYVDSSAFHAM